jgi:uncharacterized protein (DUF1330 family)
MKTDNKKFHQLVLLWITDPAKFQEYIEKMRPIVSKYGGVGDRSFQPLAVWAERMELPHIVNLVHYDSKTAYMDFNNDPEFKRIEHLRSESTKLVSYEGYLRLENVLPAGLKEREYNIEIVNYKNGVTDAYREYETEGEGKMKDYGFEVEFALDIEPRPSGMKQPDLVKISYFKNADDKAAFEKDPMHKTIEQSLYPSAIDSVIWISAKIHPITLNN